MPVSSVSAGDANSVSSRMHHVVSSSGTGEQHVLMKDSNSKESQFSVENVSAGKEKLIPSVDHVIHDEEVVEEVFISSNPGSTKTAQGEAGAPPGITIVHNHTGLWEDDLIASRKETIMGVITHHETEQIDESEMEIEKLDSISAGDLRSAEMTERIEELVSVCYFFCFCFVKY